MATTPAWQPSKKEINASTKSKVETEIDPNRNKRRENKRESKSERRAIVYFFTATTKAAKMPHKDHECNCTEKRRREQAGEQERS